MCDMFEKYGVIVKVTEEFLGFLSKDVLNDKKLLCSTIKTILLANWGLTQYAFLITCEVEYKFDCDMYSFKIKSLHNFSPLEGIGEGCYYPFCNWLV